MEREELKKLIREVLEEIEQEKKAAKTDRLVRDTYRFIGRNQ